MAFRAICDVNHILLTQDDKHSRISNGFFIFLLSRYRQMQIPVPLEPDMSDSARPKPALKPLKVAQRGFLDTHTAQATHGALRRYMKQVPGAVFTLTVVGLLLMGWLERTEYWYSAEAGVGYAFGIAGFSLMALLLLYPLRKHWKPMSRLFAIRYWFQMHMIFGVLGPTLILFHANFSLGSLNSNVALFSMLLVALSGLVGRYVYTRIHRGLYGEAIVYQDLAREFAPDRGSQASVMVELEKRLRSNKGSAFKLLADRREIRATIKRSSDPVDLQPLEVLQRMANLQLFSRLFSLWHVFHLPFFIMMCLTAVVHIVVVHMY